MTPLSCVKHTKGFVFFLFLVCLSLPVLAYAETGKVPPAPPTVKASDRGVPPRRPAARKAPDLRPRVVPVKRTKPRRTVPVVVRRAEPPTKRPAKTDKKDSWEKHQHGIALRGAALFIPDFVLTGIFFDEADGVTQAGFGLAYVLRTSKTFEFAFGVGYHFLQFMEGRDSSGAPIPHVFLNKGDQSYQREFIFNSLSYLAIDVRFLKLFDVHRRFKILFGGGIGLGILFGNLVRTDTTIPNYEARKEQEYRDAYSKWKNDRTNASNKLPNTVCEGPGSGPDCRLHAGLDETKDIKNHNASDVAEGRREERVPPVIPIVNLVFGFVFPIIIDRWDIRIQGGMGLPRFFWAGMSTHIYF